MKKVLGIVVLVGGVLVSAGARAQDASLSAARDLYVAAEYANALGMLTTLADQAPAGADKQSINLYRALCLVALGDAPEATKVIDAMLGEDPLYRPAVADLPPRMRSAFADARKRLLPTLVQQRYTVARAAFEQKEYAQAAEGFKFVLTGLEDPDMGPASSQPPLADLKVLASGFHELAAKAVAPPEPPADATPAQADSQVSAPDESRVYSAEDANVVPPLTVRQQVPAFPGRVLTSGVATLDIVINEKGGVDAASMVTSLNPQFDRMAMAAAKNWLYQPATLNGVPVKYRKRLQLTLRPEPLRR